VVAVVEADQKDARRVQQRGMQADLAERVGGIVVAHTDGGESGGDCSEGVRVAGGAEIDDEVGFIKKRAGTDSAIGGGEGYEFHLASGAKF